MWWKSEVVKEMSRLGTVLVGGGTGFIGSHLCKHLRQKGYQVTIISRMPGPQHLTWNDLKSSGLPKGTTAVVNLAGQNVIDMTQRWTAGFKQNVYNSRVNTTTSLAAAITNAKQKPKVFVQISGVGYYKPDAIKEYDEESIVKHYDFLSKMCHDMEDACKLPPGVARQVTVRSGVVLGKDGGMIQQLYLPFSLGLGGPIMPGDQFLPWIHMVDIVRLLTFSIENDNVSGVLNGVAPNTVTNREFTKAFAKAMGRPAVIPVPTMVLDFLLNEERANMLTKGQKVIPKKVMSLGFEYTYPDIMAACRELVKK